MFQISQIVYNIKTLTYKLVNLNINIQVPLQKYDNNIKIIQGCKNNINDLKKI